MHEVLNKLLESEILNEETANELKVAITEHIESAVTAARKQAITEAKAELTSQWVKERTALIEAIDTKLEEQYGPEVETLKQTIEELNDMKVDLNKKMLLRERQLGQDLKTELKQLAEDVDGFLAEVVQKELDSVKSEIKKIHEDNFGRRIFKAFAREFMDNHADEKELHENVQTLKKKLEEALEENTSLRKKTAQSERKAKIKELLSPLSGETRKIMEAVLQTVPTNRLDESYKTFLSRVLKSTSEKEPRVLAETGKGPKTRKALTEGVTRSGDAHPLPARKSPDQVDTTELDESLKQLRRMAGLS